MSDTFDPSSGENSDRPSYYRRDLEMGIIRDDSQDPFPENNDNQADDEINNIQSSERYIPERTANFWHIFGFGLVIVIANIAFTPWHAALILGFWSFFFATVIIASIFICVHLCIAEMISILPFSGGMYGFARTTVGPYLGFMVGAFEATNNIVFAMIAIGVSGVMLTYICKSDPKWNPYWWTMGYVFLIVYYCVGKKSYMKMMSVIGYICVGIVLVYIFASTPEVHPDKYLPVEIIKHNQVFTMGEDLTIVSMQYSAFFFYGIEILPLTGDEVINARKDTPRAMMATTLFVAAFGLLVMFIDYVQYPGYPFDILLTLLPLNSGFTNAFNINDHMATIFSFFPTFFSCSIYLFGFSKQLKALGNSKLIPNFFEWTIPGTNVAWGALLFGSGVGYIILLVGNAQDPETFSLITNAMYLTAFMSSYFIFILMLFSFIIFRYKYPNLVRGFRNPLGACSAVYAMAGLGLLVYVLGRYANTATEEYIVVKTFACLFAIFTVYYFAYARYNQRFSEEEQRVMFVVYLMKANEKKRWEIQHKAKAPRSLLHPATTFYTLLTTNTFTESVSRRSTTLKTNTTGPSSQSNKIFPKAEGDDETSRMIQAQDGEPGKPSNRVDIAGDDLELGDDERQRNNDLDMDEITQLVSQHHTNQVTMNPE